MSAKENVRKVVKEVVKEEVVKEVVKEAVAISEPGTPNALWCKRCQRGLTGVPEAIELVSGDDCPICSQLARSGKIGSDRIGILLTCQQARDDQAELIALRAKERELKQIRHIKSPGDLVNDEKRARVKESASLKGEIAELKNLVAKLTAK